MILQLSLFIIVGDETAKRQTNYTKVSFHNFSVKTGFNPLVFFQYLFNLFYFQKERGNSSNFKQDYVQNCKSGVARVTFQNQTALDIIFKLGCVKSLCLIE